VGVTGVAARVPPAADRQRAEIAGYRDMWRAAPAGLARRWGIASLDLGDAVCLGCAGIPGSPMLNHAVGLGVTAPATDGDLDALERFYARLGTGYVVAVGRDTGDLGDRLRARGFADDRPWVTFHREAGPVAAPAGGPRVVDADAGTAAAFGRIVAEAFALPPGLAGWLSAVVGRPGWTCQLALHGDAPIGAAALYVDGDSAWFALGATLPGRRGLGAQGSLFASRARRALELGVRHFVTETGAPLPGEGPGPSHRNMLRAGFAEVELRPNLAAPAGGPEDDGARLSPPRPRPRGRSA
jgi:hypothetical protein